MDSKITAVDEKTAIDLQPLYDSLIAADSVVMKKYISSLSNAACVEMIDELKSAINVGENVYLYQVSKIVYDKNENVRDKLVTVYSMMSSLKGCSVVMLICGKGEGIELYVGATSRNFKVNEENKLALESPTYFINQYGEALGKAFEGNFPGSKLDAINPDPKRNIIGSAFEDISCITSVSSIPALRNSNESKNEEFVQGLEKFLDTMRGRQYTAVIIADPVSNAEGETICAEYEDIYSQLSMFKSSSLTLSKSEAQSDAAGIVKSITETTNKTTSTTLSHGTSVSRSTSDSVGFGSSVSVSSSAHMEVGGLGGVSQAVSKTLSTNYSHAVTKTKGVTDSEAKTTSSGTAESLTSQNSVTKTLTSTEGRSVQLNFENRSVTDILERIEEQIKRMRSCEDFGMFNACAYFAAQDRKDAIAAASSFCSLTRGENSSIESSAINIWEKEPDSKYDNIGFMKEYLERFYHPQFVASQLPEEFTDENMQCCTTASMMISGRELSYLMTLPKKSVAGVSVLECAEFGREIVSVSDGVQNGNLSLGKIYHMHKEENTEVRLNKDNLTAHTFITGSTGSGKSNTVYKLLGELTKSGDVKFLVIEPAKGEYKNVFGNMSDVQVYGTNPKLSKLLRINPFRFPEQVHIFEHLDRLIEIFNVCWPMYAAMPAVLKSAVEKSYTDCGWDLVKSENKYDKNLYPSFADVARNIKEIIDNSEYDTDNKGAYKGSLLTRLQSLSNGVYGMIFTCDDIDDKDLFDENVIIDLSRVGSMETKSLIMGMLVLKLQEYRMSSASSMNMKLRHVTVLEEAHNLLKRTSTEQSSESANLLGKSVEMLSNSIAEMRTFGEGFIIADQSPGLLDMSVIRNTNTKIIMRLPDYSDRELVGKAASLNDDQIVELSKLPQGVAAVYQNDWVGPVLCKVDKFDRPTKQYHSVPDGSELDKQNYAFDALLDCIMRKELICAGDRTEIKNLRKAILRSNLDGIVKRDYVNYVDKKSSSDDPLSVLTYDLLFNGNYSKKIPEDEDIKTWTESLFKIFIPSINDYREEDKKRFLSKVLKEWSRKEGEQGRIGKKYQNKFKKMCEELLIKEGSAD